MIRIHPPDSMPESSLRIKGSKSISNRRLILNHLFNIQPVLKNLSDSEDTEVLQTALLNIKNKVPGTIDVREAGTDMRFLTALLSLTPGEWHITGSQRMKERPLKELVDCLRQLGADITCTEKEGFPPLLVKGRHMNGGHVKIDPGVSSQFISALLLIAPVLPGGLIIEMQGQPVSRPYIKLTAEILEQYGIKVHFKEMFITVPGNQEIKSPDVIEIEPDWSSASYWFSIMALGKTGKIRLKGLQKDSPQADSILPRIYSKLGVITEFSNGDCIVSAGTNPDANFEFDFTESPDIALTVAVTCFGLNIPCKLTGLKTLVIKESNRIEALDTELKKTGAEVSIGKDSISIKKRPVGAKIPAVLIDTYNDHRMAMSFAPLSLLVPGLMINNHGVVRKSYPSFWEDLKSLGFSVTSQAK